MGSVPVLRILSGQEPGVASGLAEPARLALLLEGAGHAVCAQVEGRTEALRTPHAPAPWPGSPGSWPACATDRDAPPRDASRRNP